MKTFYNVVNSIIRYAKEARSSSVLNTEWVEFVLQNCEKVHSCILSEVCMIKTAPHLRICSCLACVYRVMDARGKFGCRVARELNLSSVMVFRKGVCSLFIPLKLRSAVYVDTGTSTKLREPWHIQCTQATYLVEEIAHRFRGRAL